MSGRVRFDARQIIADQSVSDGVVWYSLLFLLISSVTLP